MGDAGTQKGQPDYGDDLDDPGERVAGETADQANGEDDERPDAEDERLDDELDSTFPASDPPSLSGPPSAGADEEE